MSITVYILTTQGPVRIQRITEEQTGIQSVICLDGRAQALPISSRYDAFVRNPTGVIERATGHGAYRVDVDQIIDDGDSWQLGIYIAHMVDGRDQAKDIHIFATGEVDRDLNIRPVGHIAEKLDRASRLFIELQDKGEDVYVFVPDGGTDDFEGGHLSKLASVEHVDQVFDHLKLSRPQPLSQVGNVERGTPSRTPKGRRFLLGGLSIAFLLGWFMWSPFVWMGLAGDGKVKELESAISDQGPTFMGRYQQDLFFFVQDLRMPEPISPSLSGKIILADSPEACDSTAPRRGISWDESIPASDIICEIIVRSDNPETNSVLVGRMAYWPKGLGQNGTPARTMRGSANLNGHTWTLEFEDFPNQDSIVRLVILQGRVAPVGSQPWYSDLLSELPTSAAFIAAKARIERLGYHVFVRDWQRL